MDLANTNYLLNMTEANLNNKREVYLFGPSPMEPQLDRLESFDPVLAQDRLFLDKLVIGDSVDWSFLGCPPLPPIKHNDSYMAKEDQKLIELYLNTPDSSPQIESAKPASIKLPSLRPFIARTNFETNLRPLPIHSKENHHKLKPLSSSIMKTTAAPSPTRYILEDPKNSKLSPNGHDTREVKAKLSRSHDGNLVTLPQPQYAKNAAAQGGSFMFLNLRKKGAWARKGK